MAKPRKRVKASNPPPQNRKEVRTGTPKILAQEEYDTIVWRFSIVDLDGDWGWRTVASHSWWNEILPKLQDFESMTWEEIMRASGAKKPGKGNNSHFVEAKELTKQAKKRLEYLEQDDVSHLFSLRLDSTKRIYGIRDRRALNLLWFDLHHGNNKKAVCPVKN